MVEIVSVRHHRTDITFVQYKIRPNHAVLSNPSVQRKGLEIGLFMQDDSTDIF